MVNASYPGIRIQLFQGQPPRVGLTTSASSLRILGILASRLHDERPMVHTDREGSELLG